MIDDISGNRLLVQENFILVSASQRPKVEDMLKVCGCFGDWSPAVGGVHPYTDTNGDLGEIAVWSVWLANCDPTIIQSALDKLE